MKILAIDPGNIESAYCVIDAETLVPIKFGKIGNRDLKQEISECNDIDRMVIEMIACYGMAVGKEVFDTCLWIGRFMEVWLDNCEKEAEHIYRADEKVHICGTMKAKDSNIRQALIDRFAKHDLKNGKGTKKEPDWFYGFKADIWAAYAVGLTFIETKLK